MKIEVNSFLESAKTASDKLREATSAAGQAVKDKTLQSFDRWLEEFPRVESYGLEITNFGFKMGLSPSVDLELQGPHIAFPKARLDEIIAENKSTTLTNMIFSAIRTTYGMHNKVASMLEEPLFVKIRISLSPEISVFIGKPVVA